MKFGKKRRLFLLKDFSNLSNPRFGANHTLGLLLVRLRTFFNAEICVLVTKDKLQGDCHLHRTDRDNPEGRMCSDLISTELADALLALSDDQCLTYRGEQRWWEKWWITSNSSFTDAGHVLSKQYLPRIASLLSAELFITAPMPLRGSRSARLYLTSPSRNLFFFSDCDFLTQVLDQVGPIIDNIELIDRLVSDAAETERRRIVLDLHDGVMQPYIGLKMGLMAVREKLARGNADVTDEVERLIELTNIGFGAVNSSIQKIERSNVGKYSLADAIQRIGLKFAKASDLKVEVEVKEDLDINDRLAAEVFQIVVEGLSNIRRHTQSARAFVSLGCLNNSLRIRITNPRWSDVEVNPFFPRSIGERAKSLGGWVHVAQTEDGSTVVTADIPL